MTLNPRYGIWLQDVENYAEFENRTLTLSLLADHVSRSGAQIMLNDGIWQSAADIIDGLASVTFTISPNARHLRVKFQNNLQGEADQISFRPIAAKLELGSRQTLAHQEAGGGWVLNDPPPSRACELMKCQRYQIVYGSLDNIWMLMLSTGIVNQAADGLYWPLPLPVPMRAVPTIRCNDIGLFRVYNGNHYVPENIAVYGGIRTQDGVNAVTLRAAVKSLNLSAHSVWELVFMAGARLVLDANL